MEKMTLLEVERELEQLMKAEVRTWQRTAQLLLQVRDGQLYAGQADTFTQWVRQKADQYQIHESNFWRVLKAGEFYLSIRHSANLESLQEAKATPEQLELVRKISRYAPEPVREQLVEKAISGKLTGLKELRSTWQTYRQAGEGLPQRREVNYHAFDKVHPPELAGEQTAQEGPMVRLAAANIFEALSRAENKGWLAEGGEGDNPSRGAVYYSDLYREVAVRTGTARAARRIDAVLLRKEEQAPFPHIFGIEVKVLSWDLKEDKKLSEYMPFCHYFYLAIPDEEIFLKIAAEVTLPSMGILAVDSRLKVRMHRTAARQGAPKAGETYGSLLNQASKWHSLPI